MHARMPFSCAALWLALRATVTLKNQASQTRRISRGEQSPVTQHSFLRRRLIELPQCHHFPSLPQQKRTTRSPGSAHHGWGGGVHHVLYPFAVLTIDHASSRVRRRIMGGGCEESRRRVERAVLQADHTDPRGDKKNERTSVGKKKERTKKTKKNMCIFVKKQLLGKRIDNRSTR